MSFEEAEAPAMPPPVPVDPNDPLNVAWREVESGKRLLYRGGPRPSSAGVEVPFPRRASKRETRAGPRLDARSPAT